MNRPDEHVSIEHLLPYRSSTLLVTAITDYRPARGITCSLELRGDEHYFQGHFPGNPMLPGVLEVEAMFQAACLWHALESGAEDDSRRISAPGLVLSGVKSARFQHIIVPPCSLDVSAGVEEKTPKKIVFAGSISDRTNDNSKIYATATLVTTLSG
jgi:3-hydroxyacyl-[acyl-carrier-protein] dehydratase